MPNGYGRGMGWGRGRGRGWGRGMGMGRGMGGGWCWGPPPWACGMPAMQPYPYEPTEEDLKQEIEMLKQEKADIDDEIAQIDKMLGEKKPSTSPSTSSGQH